jgi:hypothetical protein
VSLPRRTDDITDATGVDFSYAVILFEDYVGQLPDGDDAEVYAGELNEPAHPVASSEDAGILAATAYAGRPLPGKCLLSPTMELLGCDNGHGEDDWAIPLIEDDASR